MERRQVKKVKLKNGSIIGGKKIYVQSMLNNRSDDIEGNVSSAIKLEQSGCDIIRVSIPDKNSLALIEKIKEKITIPLVADIHFDYRLAIESVACGVDKIRLNPGNIGDASKVKEVAKHCFFKKVPIRIGVNSGSIEKSVLKKAGGDRVRAMVDSALNEVKILNGADFDDIVISIKSSDVRSMIKGYRMLSEVCNYPLHLGVTEAGDEEIGKTKSAIGIGSLLADGIGDTIRVSLTSDPIKEVEAGIEILKSLNLIENEITYISCPTCGRTKIDIIKLNKEIKSKLKDVHKPIKIAIMGCVVNGPGEASDADIGIAGGDGQAVLFKSGKILKKIKEEEIVDCLVDEVLRM